MKDHEQQDIGRRWRGVCGFRVVPRVTREGLDVSPKAAYSSSKLEAERLIAPLADDDFAPTVLHKGNIFGYSPRMRYDLVVNTFVKDAMRSGRIRLVYGGEMCEMGVDPEIVADYSYASVRSYRISSRKIRETVGWSPAVTIEESVRDLITHIRNENKLDFDNPRYYNIAWMKLLEESERIVRSGSSLFEAAAHDPLPDRPVRTT